jgi:predicted  nucleic acid-binding Zn-ribbon protein
MSGGRDPWQDVPTHDPYVYGDARLKWTEYTEASDPGVRGDYMRTDDVDRARAEVEAQHAAALKAKDAELAEIYRLTGADPDGDEDWRLARMALAEMRRYRAETDAEAERMDAEIATITGERDRQYDYNIEQIAKQAALEDEVARLREALADAWWAGRRSVNHLPLATANGPHLKAQCRIDLAELTASPATPEQE